MSFFEAGDLLHVYYQEPGNKPSGEPYIGLFLKNDGDEIIIYDGEGSAIYYDAELWHFEIIQKWNQAI